MRNICSFIDLFLVSEMSSVSGSLTAHLLLLKMRFQLIFSFLWTGSYLLLQQLPLPAAPLQLSHT